MNTDHVTGADVNAGAVSLAEVFRGVITRRKKLVLFTTLLFMLAGFLVITFATPKYTAISQVIVENEDTPYTRTGVAGAPVAPRQVNVLDVQSQVEVIRSHDLALKVLRRLKLIGTPEFDPLKKGIGPLGQLLITLGFKADPRKQTPEQRALSVWEKRLKVYNLPKTRVIVIEFSSSSPKIAAAVANALAEAYVEQTRDTQLQRTNEAREWLKREIDKLRQKVVEAEKKVENYRARAGLFQGTQAKLHNQQLSELAAQLVRVTAERSQAEAKARAIRELLRKGEVEKSADVLRSPLIQRLREQQVRIRRRLAELSAIYLDNHPRVKAVRKELADLKRQINTEARKIAESLEQQAKIAAAREAELRARMAKFKTKVSAAQRDEVKLRELEREAKAQRALLESFLVRYTDAMTRDAKQSLPSKARVIARAMEPALPSFPRKGPIMLLSTIAGLMLGLGLAFVLEIMAAASQPMVARPSATPAMATASTSPAAAMAAQSAPATPSATGTAAPQPAMQTPSAPSAFTIDRGDPPQTPPAQAAARLVKDWHENHGAQLVAMATLSESPAEGAEHALAAARALAESWRVMLLDVAGVDSPFNKMWSARGISDLLAGQAGFADIVHPDTRARRLHVVGSGGQGFDDGRLHGDTMRHLLQALRENYDIVLMHEGAPRFPLRARESVLPLAEGVVLFTSPALAGAMDSLKTALNQAGVSLVASIPLDVQAPALREGASPDITAWPGTAS